MAVLTILMCFASANAFAQEVRGIETRRVEYTGPSYGDYRTWYGFEFHNVNSIRVSVDIELHCSCGVGSIVTTKTIVLEPDETYVFKHEDRRAFARDSVKHSCEDEIKNYYVTYKAFELQ